MTRPQRRNKPYKPRKVDAGAVLAPMLKTQPIDAATCNAKELELRASIEALRTANAHDEDIDRLCDMVNIGAACTEYGDVPESIPAATAAHKAISAVMDRAHKLRRWGASGEELTALTEYVDWYVAIMRVSTHLEMRDATKRVNERYRRDERQRGR